MRVSPNFPLGAPLVGASLGAAREGSAPVLGKPGRRIALLSGAFLLGVGVLGAGTPASAQGFDGSSQFLDSTLQFLGFKEEEVKPEIDYRERAPLVVPPRVPDTLPAPQSSAADANPNWPKDPDVLRRKREAEASKQPVIRDDPGRPLLPSELNKGRRTTMSHSNEPVGAGSTREVLPPDKLGFTGWFNNVTGNPDKLTFNGEPERENLIQPPAGYQTPAPNAPYGVVEPKKEQWKLPTLFDRQ